MLVYKFQIPDLSRPISSGPAWRPGGELIDFHPAPLAAADIAGRRIDGVSLSIGTYGMGGAGFFGLRLGGEWLVVALRGAGAWMTADGRMIEDVFWRERGRARPWMLEGEGDWLSPRIVGRSIAHLYIKRDALQIELDDRFALSIDSVCASRPAFEGDEARAHLRPKTISAAPSSSRPLTSCGFRSSARPVNRRFNTLNLSSSK